MSNTVDRLQRAVDNISPSGNMEFLKKNKDCFVVFATTFLLALSAFYTLKLTFFLRSKYDELKKKEVQTFNWMSASAFSVIIAFFASYLYYQVKKSSQ